MPLHEATQWLPHLAAHPHSPALLNDGASGQFMLVSIVFSIASPPYKHRNTLGKQPHFVIASLALVILLCTPASAAQAPKQGALQPGCQARAPFTGINTSRLSGKMLKRWCSLERLILTTDATGRPRYPMLSFLMKWAEQSDHLIYIDLPEERSFSSAGNFLIERFDPCGERQEVIIRLYLETIDGAYVGPSSQRADGLIPFTGLNKEERYAEVLGHELAHAFHVLNDYDLTQMVEELVQQTSKQFLAFRARYKYLPLDPELEKKLTQKDAFLEELECPAMSFEKIIWQELKAKGK